MITVQVKQPRAKIDPVGIAAKIAFHYNYTLDEALRLPHKHTKALLRTISREQSDYYLNMFSVSMAPHTKKPKKIAEELKKGAR